MPSRTRRSRSAPENGRSGLRQFCTIVAMTVVALGGGVAAGWAQIPHAGAVTSEAAAPPAPIPAPRSSATLAPAPTPPRRTVPLAARSLPAPVASPAPSPTDPPAPPAAPAEAFAQGQPVRPAPAPVAAPAPAAADTCAAALAYLAANSAPGFRFECPGYALGRQAMTCVNVAGVCPGERLIAISTVCPASYMNEAHNSWIIAGYRSGGIDPYGYCH
jgi:hypothetical protein